MQPRTELFEHIQANILLAHFDPVQGGFGNTQLPGKLPVWSGTPSPPYFLCQALPQLSHIRDCRL
jgi:hypothetical protein